MKTVLLILALFASPAFAGNGSGNVSNVVGSGSAGPSPATPSSFFSIPSGATIFTITVGDWGNNMVIGDFYPLYKNGVAYQVTSGKTAYCFDILAMTNATSNWFQLVSDSSPISFAQSAALTSGVYQAGQPGKYTNVIPNQSTQDLIPGTYQFTSLRYAGIQNGNTATTMLKMDCYEN